MQQQNSICPNKGDGLEVMIFFFLEIHLTSGYITEIVTRRSGDLQIENFMRPSERLLICTMWPPEAHEFDTPGVVVIAAALQSVNLGLFPLVESYQKILKNGIHSFPA